MASAPRLRPPRPGDEAVLVAAIESLRLEGMEFAPGWHEHMSYADFLAALRDHGAELDFGDPASWVPATFLLVGLGGLLCRSSSRACHEEAACTARSMRRSSLDLGRATLVDAA